ncbi:MAG TPA: hypothetical protein VMF88_02930 [Bacteroidota bacterium]|nr:hypothetical protein [Bacteroidota bacterium]
MPTSNIIDKQVVIVRTTAAGALTEKDQLEHKRKVMNHHPFEAGMCGLSDVRGVKDIQVSPKGACPMIQIDEKHALKLVSFKLAILVSRHLVFGKARMYRSLTEKNVPSVGVFRDHPEALQWLGIHLCD